MESVFSELAARTGTTFTGFRIETGYWKFESSPQNLITLLDILFRENTFWCDFLQSASGEHLTGSQPKIRMNYHMESLTRGWKIHVSCTQDLTNSPAIPVFPSISSLWRAADWHEREAAELFGIQFEGHPDPRKLLLPSDWEGYPLRKDYQPANQYHGLKVRYERED